MASQQIICILVLTIFGAHGITLTPTEWIEGETGSFTCTNGTAVVIRLDGTEITSCNTAGSSNRCYAPLPYFTTTVDGATDTATFTINSVSRTRDTGTWSCDGDGSVVVDVKVKPIVKILMSPTESTNLMLICVVEEANPPVPDDGFTWETDGSVITGETTSTINPPAPSSDNDVYVCTGKNGVGIGRSPSVNFNIPTFSVDCRSTVAIVAFNVVIWIYITVITVTHIRLLCKGKTADNEGKKDVEVCSCDSCEAALAQQYLTECCIFVICDSCIAYSIYVLNEPVAECRDSLTWQLTFCVIVEFTILRLVLFYPMSLRLKHSSVKCTDLRTILLFIFTSAVVPFLVLNILYKIHKGQLRVHAVSDKQKVSSPGVPDKASAAVV